MGHASKKIFSHTHYGVSTVAAVLYAIAWMLGNQVRADAGDEAIVLPAVFVSAPRLVESAATLDPVTVTATRESDAVHYAMLDPVFVFASRDVESADVSVQPAVLTATSASMAGAPRNRGFVSNLRSWMVNALLQ
jgi:hypothetical protein